MSTRNDIDLFVMDWIEKARKDRKKHNGKSQHL